MPGMKWSTVLLVASIGMRTTVVQVAPSVEVLITMSLELHPLRKRQSCQATNTLPAPSISAEGRGPVRRPPATVCLLTEAMVTGVLQVEPPLVDRNARIEVSLALAIGTITVPLGCTTGWPPIPVALPPVFLATPHVNPPSVDVLILIRLPLPWSSHCV